MTKVWKLQDAKNCFSEVIEKATIEGPQTVTKRGEPAAVILSFADFQKLVEPKENLVAFFAKSPLRGVKLDLERAKDMPRKVDL